MKYRYKVSNLECANCASKIEKKLNDDKRIDNAVVNFSNLTIMVETREEGEVKQMVQEVVNEVEPGVNVTNYNDVSRVKSNVISHSIRLVIGAILALLGTFVFGGIPGKILVILGYATLLLRTFLNAVKLIIKSRTINENLLVTISCVGAYLTDNISEGLMVIILYEIGKILEEIAVNNSRKSIGELMNIRPEYANLKRENKAEVVAPEMVKKGDVIVVKQGERVPLDGVILSGAAKLNTAALTGESELKKVSRGDEVLSGSVNTSGLLEIKVTSLYSDSTVSRILNLVETATDRKAKTETFVARAAKVYTPIVLALAVLVAITLPLLFNVSLNDAVYRALVFLVISCPCAIAISVPLSYFSGIGKASKEGILIKGSDYLDALGDVKKIIFDKTGTITTGNFSDYELAILDNDYSKKEVISYYVNGEKLSNHPIAKSIVNVFGKQKSNDKVTNFKEHAGKGISYEIDGKEVRVGSASLCGAKGKDGRVYLCVDGKLIASLLMVDGIKKDAKKTISKLKKLGIVTKMFTGDSKKVAVKIANEVGMDAVAGELLPEDKYNMLEKEISSNEGKTAFVGDGINDAPSLALADVGISMGGVGSASAIEASDVVIMNDELEKIVDGINVSKFTSHIIRQNLVFSIGVKVLVLCLSALGIASMWQAVFADTGVTLLTILNTTRILKK